MKQTNHQTNQNGRTSLRIPSRVRHNIRRGLSRGYIWAEVGNTKIINDEKLIKAIENTFIAKGEKEPINIFYLKQGKAKLYTPEELIRMSEYSHLIIDKGYSPDVIEIERKVGGKGIKLRADIIVYTNVNKSQISIVIECKQAYLPLTDAKNQVMLYGLEESATYVKVTSGDTEECGQTAGYHRIDNPFPKISDLPNVNGIIAEESFFKDSNKGRSRNIITEEDFKNRLAATHKLLDQNGFTVHDIYKVTNKLLFCLALEEQITLPNEAYEFEATGKTNLSNFYNKINSLYAKLRKTYLNQTEAGLIIPENRADLLFDLVELFHDIILNKSKIDWAYIYHTTMYPAATKKQRHANFTPENLIMLGYRMTRPKPTDIFADITAGYGSFLIGSIKYFQEIGYEEYPQIFGDNAKCLDTGLDIISTTLLNLFSKNFSGKQAIRCDSTLPMKEFTLITGITPDSIDIQLLNPPFKLLSKIFRRSVEISKPGKTMGIILPYDFLLAKKYQNLRDYLFDNCKVPAILAIYPKAFKDTNVQTLFLFFEKNIESEKNLKLDYKMFFGNLKTDFDIEQIANLYWAIRKDDKIPTNLKSLEHRILQYSDISNNTINLNDLFYPLDLQKGNLSIDEIQNNFNMMQEDYKRELINVKKNLESVKKIKSITVYDKDYLTRIPRKEIENRHLYRQYGWADITDGGNLNIAAGRIPSPDTKNPIQLFRFVENSIIVSKLPNLASRYRALAITKKLADDYKSFLMGTSGLILHIDDTKLNLESAQGYFWSDLFAKQTVHIKHGSVQGNLMYAELADVHMPIELPDRIEKFIIKLVRQYRQLITYEQSIPEGNLLLKYIFQYKKIIQQTINAIYYEISKKMKPFQNANK